LEGVLSVIAVEPVGGAGFSAEGALDEQE